MPTGVLNANKMPLKAHELILVFYSKLPTYNPIKWRKKLDYDKIGKVKKANIMNSRHYGLKHRYEYVEQGERYPLDVIKFSNFHGTLWGDTRNTVKHPTQKPVDLLEYLIKTYSNPGDTVLDFTMGSGSTGVACVNTERKFIGIEINEDYFKIAQERIDRAVEDMKLSKAQVTIFDLIEP